MAFDIQTAQEWIVETLNRIGAPVFADNFSKYGRQILTAIQDAGINDPGHGAYVLATSSLESQHKPQKEWKAREGTVIWETAQKYYWHTGYYGRGFVQLTLEDNYRKWSQKLGVDLLSNPDLALKVDIAARILCEGMRDGEFTGHKLADYGSGRTYDVGGARTIVNPGEGARKLGLFQSAWLEYYNILIAS